MTSFASNFVQPVSPLAQLKGVEPSAPRMQVEENSQGSGKAGAEARSTLFYTSSATS